MAKKNNKMIRYRKDDKIADESIFEDKGLCSISLIGGCKLNNYYVKNTINNILDNKCRIKSIWH